MTNPSDRIQPVSDQISVTGQLSPQQIEQLSQQGFQSVMNLRSYQEEGADEQDRQRIESGGLSYVNLPIKPAELTRETVDQVIQKISALPKPLLIYCGSAMRATFMALVYLAGERDLTLEEIRAKGRSLGFEFEDKPAFNQLMEAYAKKQDQ
mgnify:FL=1